MAYNNQGYYSQPQGAQFEMGGPYSGSKSISYLNQCSLTLFNKIQKINKSNLDAEA
jgi:hypothetical protein